MNQVKRGPNVTEVKDLFGGGTKVLDRSDGLIECIVSVTGVEDTVADVIEPGAYRKTIESRRPKGIRSHDWDRFASKAIAYDELLPGDQQLPAKTGAGEPWPRAAGAIKVLAQYNLDTKDGAEGFSNAAFLLDEAEWSIGYNVERGHARMVKGVRHIDVMTEWFEYSDVLWGAMPLARGAGLKALGGMAAGGGLWIPEDAQLKALPGSDEERRDALEEALNAAYRAEHPPTGDGMGFGYQNIRATFADRVVTCFRGDGHEQDWEYGYRFENGEVELLDRRPVNVVESVEADAGDGEVAPVEGAQEKLDPSELAAQAALYEEFTR